MHLVYIILYSMLFLSSEIFKIKSILQQVIFLCTSYVRKYNIYTENIFNDEYLNILKSPRW